jgi:nucleoside diphosphate kinase
MFNFVPVYADFAEGVIVGAGTLAAVAVVYANRSRIASLFKRAEATVAAGVGQEISAIRKGLVNLENTASAAYASVGSALTNVHNAAQADVKSLRGDFGVAVDGLRADLIHASDRLVKLESAVFGADHVQAPADPAPVNPAPTPAEIATLTPAASAAPAQAQ